jgi:hypothetical protein
LQVFTSSGNTAIAVGYTLSWTLGEPVIETLTGTNNILTQGMHQTNLIVTNLQDITFPGLEIKVYPNPTGDFLKIEVIQGGNELFLYELSDITGRRLLLKEMQSLTKEIDMKSYVPGSYILHLFNSGHEHVKTCKIIKN